VRGRKKQVVKGRHLFVTPHLIILYLSSVLLNFYETILAWLGLRFYPFLIGLEGLLGESRGIALLSSVYLDTRWGWVVSATPRPPCFRERPGTHFTGGWVGLGAGLDRCGKPRLHRDSIPGPSNP
jgi:hypothetical protein